MENLKQVLAKLTKINYHIKTVMKESTYDKYDDMSGLEINYNNPEQLMLLDELRSVMDKLYDIKHNIEYLNKPISYTGILSKSDDGRYELSNRDRFASGYTIEFLLVGSHFFSTYEADAWVKTRVEHDGSEYYLFGYKEISMDGLIARIRR